jgi:hypothetical protein
MKTAHKLWLVVIGISILATIALMAAQTTPVNGGWQFVNNGPCTPQNASAGPIICNNNGVLTIYGTDGSSSAYPFGGSGTLTGTLTCGGEKNKTVGTGFTLPCTFQITGYQ